MNRARRAASIPLLMLGIGASPALLAGTRIHVRGQAKVDAHAARAAGDLVLSGALRDDTGDPLRREAVTLSLAHDDDARRAVVFDGPHAARPCSAGPYDDDAGAHLSSDDRATPRAPATTGPVILTTDDAGRFCVRVALPRERYVAQLIWGGGPLIDAVKLDLSVDLARQALSLAFDPEPRVLSLDAPFVSLEAVASVEEDGITRGGSLLPLQLTNERGDVLGTDYTDGSGRLKLTVSTKGLGAPGKGELRLSFAGNTDTGQAAHIAFVERHGRVSVRAPLAESGELLPASPEDGIALPLVVSAKGFAVTSGTVEARVGDAVVGAAPVENGAASLVVTFASASDAEVPLRLRYAPSTPWFEAGDETVLRLPVKGPSPWRQAPLVLAGLVVVGWLASGRLKRKAPPPVATPQKPPVSRGEAKIDVVRQAKSSKLGWTGRVSDAHDGTPVRQARITIQRPGFERAEVIADAYANDHGRFELRADTRPGDELSIEAPFHAGLKQPMPPCGELEISIVLRKRKLLDRLVAWARLRGRPFDARPEPTPGHVRRAAGEDLATARWADAVERAAYGGGQVDARTEAEVDRLAPAAPKSVEAAKEGAAAPPPPPMTGATVKDLPRDRE